ncbi:hypothetical protein BD560DRAFT_402126 [Blakeslea trispora]|nr:hypothetical protein BD560DRAFT_402126 [Blakeslea trispora]
MPDEEESAKKPPTVLDIILNDFIRQDHLQTYSLPHLSHHGRTMIVPILAKLFQLTTKEVHSKRHIKLEKTLSTCIPSSFIDYKHQLKKKRKTKVKLSPYEKKIKKQQDKKLFKENELHGKEVASNSAPIPASNKGHRMLSAMGWKEGDAIGKDGIKEPVKAFMRANRRGLGA